MHSNKKIGSFFSLKSLDSTPNLHPTASSVKNSLSQQVSFSPSFNLQVLKSFCASYHWALFGWLSQQVDNELIGGEHYSRVGNLPNELWNESSVKSSIALLHRHQAGRLEKVFIFATLFSQPRPNDLWGGWGTRKTECQITAEIKCLNIKKNNVGSVTVQ